MREKYKHKCVRCGNVWESYLKNPKACTRCKSYSYNIPRKRKTRTQWEDETVKNMAMAGKKNKNNIDKLYADGHGLDDIDLS